MPSFLLIIVGAVEYKSAISAFGAATVAVTSLLNLPTALRLLALALAAHKYFE